MKDWSQAVWIERALLVKSTLLAILLLGIVALSPMTHFLQTVAHQVCLTVHPQGGPCRPS